MSFLDPGGGGFLTRAGGLSQAVVQAMIDASVAVVAAYAGRRSLGFWFIDNIAASATSNGVRASNHVSKAQLRSGTVTGIVGHLTANAAGSDLLVRVSVNGVVSSALTLTIPVGSRVGTLAGTPIAYVAGDLLRYHCVTDGSWTATTVDLSGDIEVQETA